MFMLNARFASIADINESAVAKWWLYCLLHHVIFGVKANYLAAVITFFVHL